jgi:hypothetical protein
MTQRVLGPGMFLALHDPFTGRPALGRRLLTCAVVAAELAELVIADDLDVVGVGVVTHADRIADEHTRDGVGDFIVGAIRREQTVLDIPHWVEELGEMLFELNARHLVERGIVRRVRMRGLLRRTGEAFPAEDLLAASHLRIRLRHMIMHPRELDLNGALGIALLHALGALGVLDGVDVDDAFYRDLRQHLPDSLRLLVAEIEQAVTAVGFAVR